MIRYDGVLDQKVGYYCDGCGKRVCGELPITWTVIALPHSADVYPTAQGEDERHACGPTCVERIKEGLQRNRELVKQEAAP